MICRLFVAAVFGWALLAGVGAPQDARADDLDDRVADIEEFLDEEDYKSAYDATRALSDLLWERLPFSVDFAALVEEKAPQYGLYRERAAASYSAGEPIYVYMEATGYTFAEADHGYQIRASVDLNILDSGGVVVAGQEDFGKFTIDLGAKTKEFMMNMTVTLTGAPAGDYILEFIVHDTPSGESDSVRVPITLG